MRRASSSRPAARMLAVKPPVCWTAGRVLEVLSMHASASGGSSDTAQKALTVKPRGMWSWPNAVSTTTPLGRLAMTSRNSDASITVADDTARSYRTLVCKPESPQTNLVGRAIDLFSPATREWFRATFAEPTQVQERGWNEVAAGGHVLMAAPTGSGKTLAAFLWCIDRLASEATPPEAERCRVLYVSPLKALAHAVDRNLRSPLVGLRRQIDTLGLASPDITVAIRTGDTPADVRRSMERHPPDILITTPESLYLLLPS